MYLVKVGGAAEMASEACSRRDSESRTHQHVPGVEQARWPDGVHLEARSCEGSAPGSRAKGPELRKGVARRSMCERKEACEKKLQRPACFGTPTRSRIRRGPQEAQEVEGRLCRCEGACGRSPESPSDGWHEVYAVSPGLRDASEFDERLLDLRYVLEHVR